MSNTNSSHVSPGARRTLLDRPRMQCPGGASSVPLIVKAIVSLAFMAWPQRRRNLIGAMQRREAFSSGMVVDMGLNIQCALTECSLYVTAGPRQPGSAMQST